MFNKGIHDRLSLIGAVLVLIVGEIEDDIDLTADNREPGLTIVQLPIFGLPEAIGELPPFDVLIGVFEECLARMGVYNGRTLVLFGWDDNGFLALQLHYLAGIADMSAGYAAIIRI